MTNRNKNEYTGKSRQEPLGKLILTAIRRAIERTTESSKALPLPGEGDERPFRNWLRSNLLVSVLGWPEDKVRSGEGFDILLLDEFDHEAVTIETKAPFHKSSEKERINFEERLQKVPRLKAAYFTNGVEWDRLDLTSPEGVQEVYNKAQLDISVATVEEAESFFMPLRGDRYFQWGKRNRSLVTRYQTHILEQLAGNLDSIVDDLRRVLASIFQRYEQGDAGTSIEKLTQAIFDDWCSRSLQAPLSQVLKAVQEVLQRPPYNHTSVSAVLRDQGFTPVFARETADRLLSLRADHLENIEAVRSALTPAYRDSILKLCTQSAHLLLARCLVYRVGEDMDLFEQVLSGDAMDRVLAPAKDSMATEPLPAMAIIESIRRRMIGILPTIYQLSDLDWWRVSAEKQASVEPIELSYVQDCQGELDHAVARMLRILDTFHFASVDADVWRNVYQHYLPADERQRLGEFYTPEDLVEFILDMSGYIPEAENLCKKKVLDPACGSGAFVNIAAARLLDHLSRPMACHAELKSGNKYITVWQREKAVLDTVLSNINAIDIHPFAAFLTTLNLIFLLLPHYAIVHKHNPDYPLTLHVYSVDSLEKPDEQCITPYMFDQLNSRIQLSADSFEKYRTFITQKFDLVMGNPPWGGVLKGPLAPVYDEAKKVRFKREYPYAANGKYDIYGLFMERGLQLLVPGGRFAMVTQDTYLDKEWARKLRGLLSKNSEVQSITGLNPFGGLFFGRMNTPAVTVYDNRLPTKGSFIAVTTTAFKFGDMNQSERRAFVLDTVRRCLAGLSERRRQATVDFCTSGRLPRSMLRETAEKGWDLRPGKTTLKLKQSSYCITEILEPRQGVTPGGCLDVFLMSDERAKDMGLENQLVHRAIKTRETERWYLHWQGRVLLYPYILFEDKAIPAFTLTDSELDDALDFETTLDEQEREIKRGRALDNAIAKLILEHRIALGLVKYPFSARYLVEHYMMLEGRVFEKQHFTAKGKKWYEYHRPRAPKQLLRANRILSPRLTRQVRFSLDKVGYLADDACQYLLPTANTQRCREELQSSLSSIMEHPISDVDLLLYCLAFLNSQYAQQVLTSRRPTPKGSYQISKQYLSEIPVLPPPSREDAETILQLVTELDQFQSPGERAVLENRLDSILNRLLM